MWLRTQRADDARETEIAAAAETAVAAVLSYDHRRLAAGRADARALLTGDAAAQYDEVAEPLARTARRLESVVDADIKATTVLEHDDDSADVLLFVDQMSSSRKLSQPQLDQSRVVVTLVHEEDAWLVSTLAAQRVG